MACSSLCYFFWLWGAGGHCALDRVIVEFRPAEYLARRKEILTHFDEIAEACVAEKEHRLLKLFQYNYVSHFPTVRSTA